LFRSLPLQELRNIRMEWTSFIHIIDSKTCNALWAIRQYTYCIDSSPPQESAFNQRMSSHRFRLRDQGICGCKEIHKGNASGQYEEDII